LLLKVDLQTNLFIPKQVFLLLDKLITLGEKRDVTKTGNGEWGMGNGEWEMGNGKWE